MTLQLKKYAAIGLVAFATLATASSAFADRNQYTRHRAARPGHHMMHRGMMKHHMMRHHMMRRHAM